MNASSSKTRIRRGAVSVIKRLRDAGFQAFLVGGAVRDKLLGRIPREYDIATEATPEQVMSIFARTVPVGAQFGVILVLDKDGEFEVATFRAEGKYSDGRRPDNISFVSAREDVLRRDFTINGLLEDPLTGTIEDFVDGRADIQAKLIRAIGDPVERFAEDHLRVLRALRFSATLGFDIEAQTLAAATQMAESVKDVAAERIHQELTRCFSEGDPARAYDLLVQTGILNVVLPQADRSATEITRRVFERLGACDFGTALATMLPADQLSQVDKLAQQLRLSTQEKTTLQYLMKALPAFGEERSHANNIRFIRHKLWPQAARLHRAQREAANNETSLLDALETLLSNASPEQLHPQRLLTGNDLQAMGLKPGPHFKSLLETLETEQLEGRITTQEQAEALIHSLAD
ncbi:MAG TPA: CCA tRNA nucleotidyltransferase [Myxococcales bacterium]|nr:CCA tRNA nucleotidyltransferase [Myxococcales bacterium]HIN86070.1 CCA tRNA nucleotidyltransferase [Myxococcales bacterium]